MLSRRSKLLIAFALVAGAALRLVWLSDMEYKTDEMYMFERLMRVGVSEPWPWLGVPSGVYIRNPGMSVWVFLALGKLAGAADPVALCRAVALLNVAALGALLWLSLRVVKPSEREPWLWALAL